MLADMSLLHPIAMARNGNSNTALAKKRTALARPGKKGADRFTTAFNRKPDSGLDMSQLAMGGKGRLSLDRKSGVAVFVEQA